MEAFLHYIWEHRLWERITPKGILAGCSVEVIDTGLCNTNAGPDFFEAKIQIDDITWVGAVEIHSRASEWIKHRHQQDPVYEGTILHVVEHWDSEIHLANGRLVPCLELAIPNRLREQAKWLIHNKQALPCSTLCTKLETNLINSYLDNLALQRLREKAKKVCLLAEQSDWYEALYITLFRAYGFGLNNDVMELLAHALPYKLIGRYRDNNLQFDALLYGQANLIEDIEDEVYRHQVLDEYSFLRNKHRLEPIDRKLWKRLRTRPASFPIQRLRQVAMLIRQANFSPSSLTSANTLAELRAFFSSTPSSSIPTLIINVALPLRLAYHKSREDAESQALSDLRELPAEQNKITRLFTQAGIPCRHAADSQALIQLHYSHCQAHKCFYCWWGKQLMGHYIEQ